MNDVLSHVLDAHGGLERWSQIDRLQADVILRGPFWAVRGFSEKPSRERLTVETRREVIRLSPWKRPERDILVRAEDDAVEVRVAADDTVLESRSGIRSTYAGYELNSPWESLQVGYFIGYAMWNYLTTPFLLTYPGVTSREGERCVENGEVWHRLEVHFPRSIATHCARQTFYFGDDGLLRRLDYNVDVNVGVAVAHYVGAYREFDGIKVPTRRRVHRWNPDDSLSEDWSIGIDIESVWTV
ncbi:hypothetical protein BX257_0473 [Streptomyces sp. 3212.3]|uniref:hypothetical protein n=1 Tax=Streptomyces sp. 3212.3 TaxID=1938846 RepID=UPI000E398AF5|nr:hypothetical protein [Streptomyces sp. 3212.3]REE58072.1 hypothetical protein BX257_0473 [Streptomyces sp. 3212.3]